MKDRWLVNFVQESLNIEDIWRQPTDEELLVTWEFIQKGDISIPDLVNLVSVYQPDATLRDNETKRVWIGGKEASKGGLGLLGKLGNILWEANQKVATIPDAWFIHNNYELLHPFTDGNGRSGRALWANLMYHQGYDFKYRFLQMYYYQTLQHYDE